MLKAPWLAAAAFFISGLTHALPAQTVEQAPGEQFRANGVYRFFFGSGYRNLWTTPIEVSVLDLHEFDGGLTPVGRTVSEQVRGLVFRSANGFEYTFRSIDKDPTSVLPSQLRNTLAADVIRDQISASHPTGVLVVDQLMTRIGILHSEPRLVVLPDDAALEEYQTEFAGRMGTFERKVDAATGRGWSNATQVISSDSLFRLVAESPDDRVDARGLLAARLFDILIGDWDRNRGQWRWAHFGDSVPRIWHPIPVDRDQSFARFDGMLLMAARQMAPQLTYFSGKFPNIEAATYNGRELDRRFLVQLERQVWDSVTLAMQTALSDSTLTEAVARLPQPHAALSADQLLRALKQRREQLPKAANAFYRLLAGTVDVRGTNANDHAEIVRGPDGSLGVALSSGRDSAAYLRQWFRPDETREVRVFLGEGHDTAVVRGNGRGITLRLLGGRGQDQLVDSADGGRDRFYDNPGGPVRTAGFASKVNRKRYVEPPLLDPNQPPPRDWGHRWRPIIWSSIGPDLGAFLGGGVSLTTFGFRKYPFASRHRFRAGFATDPGTFRVDYLGEFHGENTPTRIDLLLRASGIEVNRFFGFGNETRDTTDDSFFRVTSERYTVAPSFTVPLIDRFTFSFGPELVYVSTKDRPERLLSQLAPYGAGEFGELGVRFGIHYDTRDHPLVTTRGSTLELGAAVHPSWWHVERTYGEISGVATTFLSPGMPLSPTFALRAGGKKMLGKYPFFDAAYIGDAQTVRLGRSNRYAGDAAVFGSAEVRLAIVQVNVLVPTQIGVFGLGDLGRVFLEGEQSNKWHAAWGGGFWFAVLSPTNAISVTATVSEERAKVYVQAGFGF
jgi:hypothetical protein